MPPTSVNLLGAPDGLLDTVGGPATCRTTYWVMGLPGTTNPSGGGYVAARGGGRAALMMHGALMMQGVLGRDGYREPVPLWNRFPYNRYQRYRIKTHFQIPDSGS